MSLCKAELLFQTSSISHIKCFTKKSVCVCVCVCVSVLPSLSLCVDVFKEAILEVKWLQEEHLLALRGPPPVTSSPKFNFQAPLQAVHLKKWRLSLLATLQNKMRLRSAGNAPEERTQRSLLISREKEISVVSV